MKYIVVTGGVISGLGKGITASSIGLLLKNLGLRVTAIKIDPYFNVDAGLMSPYEHGEVYVLEDGTETDLDLGNYERFLGIKLTKNHSITSGRIFWEVINAERGGRYLGKTVQIMPHVTDHIKGSIKNTALIDVGNGTPDVCIIEVGGTVGDMEGAHFTESIRQLMYEDPKSWCSVHVSLLVDIGGECKTKPTQNSIRELRKVGITPDFIVCRSKSEPSRQELDKIGLMCQVSVDNIIKAVNVESIYKVPEKFYEQKIHDKIISKLGMFPELLRKEDVPETIQSIFNVPPQFTTSVNIGIVGKYTTQVDSYLSVIRAIDHASFSVGVRANPIWIEASLDTKELMIKLNCCDAVIIPGGFGIRGTQDMIEIAEWTLRNKVPTLGICLGFQIMSIVLARFMTPTVISEEFMVNRDPSLPLLFTKGDMKVGSHKISDQDFVGNWRQDKEDVTERFRHRYHIVNNADKIVYNKVSNAFISQHPLWFGVQFHPEFNSAWGAPSPYFVELLKIAKK